jgi:hypothetical protein
VKIQVPTALLALALLSAPAAAQAAPARIRVFEAQVHASPDPASPVIHTFVEDTHVSVSEDVINGFRKVRLPDGKVGYVDESALALSEEAVPQGPPPGMMPPPPPSVAPPPPPPPPPPYWSPYRPVRIYDPTARRHVGLFLRFDFGLGYLDASTPADATLLDFRSTHGPAGEFGFAMGGAIKENFILAGHFWGSWAVAPTLEPSGPTPVFSGGDFTTSLVGFGPSFDWYLMPADVYFTVTPSLTWVNFSDLSGGFQTSAGFGTRFAVGKEWWVAPHWAVGVSGWFAFSFNHESAAGTWHTYTGGLGFSSTFN